MTCTTEDQGFVAWLRSKGLGKIVDFRPSPNGQRITAVVELVLDEGQARAQWLDSQECRFLDSFKCTQLQFSDFRRPRKPSTQEESR